MARYHYTRENENGVVLYLESEPAEDAVHDIDHDQKSKQRKTHAHVIVVWGGNTTRKAIINVLNRLSADGKKCCSSAEPINNIRHAYDYLIHDTASCRKKGKELYPVEAMIRRVLRLSTI